MAQVLIAPEMSNEYARLEPRFPVKVDAVFLAGADKDLVVPVNAAGRPTASWVRLKVIGDTAYVCSDAATAVAPTADTQNGADDGSACWAIEAGDGPQWFSVRGLVGLSLISSAAVVHAAWYREPTDAA